MLNMIKVKSKKFDESEKFKNKQISLKHIALKLAMIVKVVNILINLL